MKKIALLAFGIFATQYCFLQPAFCNESSDLDKSIYNIFNPTPKDKMREFDTDRPDKIETPHTVDAGHFQIETDKC